MDREEFLKSIKEIGECEDATERLSKLTHLSDEVTKVYDNADTLNTTISTLNDKIKANDEQISNLQKANMDYFLRLENSKSAEDQKNNGTGIQEQEEEKLKFEDCFNEKGELI